MVWSKNIFLKLNTVYYILFILFIIGFISQPVFLSMRCLKNIFINSVALGIASIGQTIVMLTGGIDLSIGSVISLTNVLAAFLMKQYPNQIILIVILCIFIGLMVGLINGVAVAYLKMNAFLFTLACGTAVQGITLEIMYQPGGFVPRVFRNIARGFLGPLPIPILLIFLLYFIFNFILKRTAFGISIYAIGGNINSAILSGIKVKNVLLVVYALNGLLGALAGLFLASRIASGDPLVGEPYSLDSITASLLGGTSLFGGIGNLWNTYIGSIILVALNTLLNLNNVSSFIQWIVKGIMLISTLALSIRKRG